MFVLARWFVLIACVNVMVSAGEQSSQVLRLGSLNICEGGGNRVERIAAWLRDADLDIVALQELNGWSEARLQEEARAWNHSFVSLMETKLEGQHYNFGVTSRRPLHVKEKRTAGFWHGLFHLVVYLGPESTNESLSSESLNRETSRWTDSLRIDLLLTHLNPRSARDRLKEVEAIVDIVKDLPLFVVMGDLNSLSPLDSLHYERVGLVEVLRSHAQLADKYLTASGAIDYAPIETLSLVAHDLDYFSERWNLDWFSHSVPSPLNADAMHASPMRIDYVFASPEIFDHDIRACGIVHSPVTDALSDHYPIVCEFEFFYDELF